MADLNIEEEENPTERCLAEYLAAQDRLTGEVNNELAHLEVTIREAERELRAMRGRQGYLLTLRERLSERTTADKRDEADACEPRRSRVRKYEVGG